jgi:CBS domain-containing protein
MHKGVGSVSPNMLVAAAVAMQDKDISAIRSSIGKVISMITDRDIVIRAIANGRDLSTLTARDVMSTDVTCCLDSDDAGKAIRLMESKEIRRLPVLDANDKLVGMLSLGDISHLMSDKVTAEVLKSVSAHHG